MKLYDPTKYYNMMRIKQLILTNQLKRLSKAGKRANFVIIYYSLALIVYSIFKQFFPYLVNVQWIDFSSVIISIIILISSIINSNSRYLERAKNIEIALSNIKILKRRVANIKDETNQKDKFIKIKREYDELCKDVEFRDDLDFYYTVQYLVRQVGLSNKKTSKEPKIRDLSSLQLSEQERVKLIDEIRGYMTEINPGYQKLHILIKSAFHFAIYFLPLFIIAFCIFTK